MISLHGMHKKTNAARGHSRLITGRILLTVTPLLVAITALSSCTGWPDTTESAADKDYLVTGTSVDDLVGGYLPYVGQKFYYIDGPFNKKIEALHPTAANVLVFKGLELSTSTIQEFYLANDLKNLGTTRLETANYVDIETYNFHFTDASGQEIVIRVNPMRRDVSYGPQDHIWPPNEFFIESIDAKETKMPGGGTSYRSFGLLQPYSFYSVESIDAYFSKTASSSDILDRCRTRQDFVQYYKKYNTPDNSTNASKALLQAENLYAREGLSILHGS